jgi:hypothetical protein
MPRCLANNRNGKRCSNLATEGSVFCHTHPKAPIDKPVIARVAESIANTEPVDLSLLQHLLRKSEGNDLELRLLVTQNLALLDERQRVGGEQDMVDCIGEKIHPDTLYALISIDCVWLAFGPISDTIKYWQLRVQNSEAHQGNYYSNLLRKIGLALDPTKRGSHSPTTEIAICTYDFYLNMILEAKEEWRKPNRPRYANARAEQIVKTTTHFSGWFGEEAVAFVVSAGQRGAKQLALEIVSERLGKPIDTVKGMVKKHHKT